MLLSYLGPRCLMNSAALSYFISVFGNKKATVLDEAQFVGF